MTFLEAKQLLASFTSIKKLPLLLGMSGSPSSIDLYLKAHAAIKGYEAEIQFLPFGTLSQSIISLPTLNKPEIWLLFPWDLIPECDWRSGIANQCSAIKILLKQAEEILKRISKRKQGQLIYIATPIPPLYSKRKKNNELAISLQSLSIKHGALVVQGDGLFSLSSYLASGSPFGGNSVDIIAEQIIDLLLLPPSGSGKVLVTDLDETLWSGLVGEDGPENISAFPEGKGFPHFIYQSMLKQLKSNGALLAVASRNDIEIARQPLVNGNMTLKLSDFVVFKAGYGSKANYISEMALELNLNLNSFVFVDDNPIELAEVNLLLPSVTCLAFGKNERDLSKLLNQLSFIFERDEISEEDIKRTELYQRRMESIPLKTIETKEQLKYFLKGLCMVLTIKDRKKEDSQRALQLINKTNQFNLNGNRLEKAQLDFFLDNGGRLLTASLEDRTGSHGEILVCLVNKKNLVISLVMSCRVFQRRIEYAFICWLANKYPDLTFDFKSTDRNEPIRNFVADSAYIQTSNYLSFDNQVFLSKYNFDMLLFTVKDETQL